jgi:hypothetical protein
VTRAFLVWVLVLLSSCAPSLEGLYQPYREAHEWVYTAERSGLNAAYRNIIRVSSEPHADHSLIRVHIFPDDADASIGARHTYRLEWNGTIPQLTRLNTQAGNGTLEPGLPLPDFRASSGDGEARYANGNGLYAGQSFSYSWRYTPDPNPFSRRADLELRSSLKLTDSNIRLEFQPGVGIQRAEWKTVYGVAVTFTLESFK